MLRNSLLLQRCSAPERSPWRRRSTPTDPAGVLSSSAHMPAGHLRETAVSIILGGLVLISTEFINSQGDCGVEGDISYP